MARFPGVGSWIERRARIAPDHVALVHREARRSYADLAERIGRLASGLRELGVARGDRVGWLGESHPAFLETLFATAKLGAVFAPVNHRLPAGAAATIFEDYAVKVVIAEDAAAATELPGGAQAVHVRGEPSTGSFEDLIAGARTTRADASVDPDDVCIMPHTSGTTGSPKGVMLTHANVTWNAVNMISVADLRSDDVTLALAPLFRTGGVGVNVLPLLFKGGTVVVPVATTPNDVLDAIERERVTVGFGNPDLLDALTLSPRWTTADLSSVRFVITGGAPVPERLIRTYGDRGVTFLQGYGLSEASPVVSVLDAASAPRKSGSVGKPLMFVDVRTARRDGSECAPRETGELLVKGPNVMAGYWNRPEATRAAIDERGWLHTGDAASIDEEGFVWIIDRVEHAFTSHGHVVYPGDVERCIGEHPAVRDVGVVGVDGSGRAFVVLHDAAEVSATDIIEHCRARLDPPALPAAVAFVDALPRTSVGKLDRPALIERERSPHRGRNRAPGSREACCNPARSEIAGQ
jgi:acyl-CoA synthetase (AMP-forming)/AMP-acid ligase II